MSALYIGLMSGTSLDGVDAVIADLARPRPQVVGHAHLAFPAALREELQALCSSGDDEIHRSQVAAIELARVYAGLVRTLLNQTSVAATSIKAIGCHGQTVRHMPAHGYTVQLNAPAILAEETDICVVSDFRARDLAAGGQGAPLVPAFHASLFGSTDRARAVLNLGGMANLTLLESARPVRGFDSGPANVLMDAWIAHRRGLDYDRDGAWAASGQVDAALLAKLLAHPFFAAPPPKSCGREQFNLEWLLELLPEQIRDEDVQATLAELTAQSVADALNTGGFRPDDVAVCGGGAFNHHLLQRLALHVGRPVRSSADEGVPPEQVEALAFAWLAQRTLNREPGNLPEVTGARGLRVLGAVWPA
ncbi:anhydro-N-acetylmuramic acid kinase [Methyloversatilis discipulorum]|uniref:anhydro-N-acetylmuramic acid kinase n=1 Tax=Methyloversatilis discipulorum TaxID=1119528 RepID=UPI000364F121|nr:anhydro-N-acetylmuramic acid kinase [Methyloversatilis discipulorum]